MATYSQDEISKMLEAEKKPKSKSTKKNSENYLQTALNACKQFNKEFSKTDTFDTLKEKDNC